MQHQNYFQQKYENMKKAKRHTEEMNRIFPDSVKNMMEVQKTDHDYTFSQVQAEENCYVTCHIVRDSSPRIWIEKAVDKDYNPTQINDVAAAYNQVYHDVCEYIKQNPSEFDDKIVIFASNIISGVDLITTKCLDNNFGPFELTVADKQLEIKPIVTWNKMLTARVEYWMINGSLDFCGDESLWRVAETLVRAEDIIREAENSRFECIDFYVKEILPMDFIPYDKMTHEMRAVYADSNFSDWHKDCFGCRPHTKEHNQCLNIFCNRGKMEKEYVDMVKEWNAKNKVCPISFDEYAMEYKKQNQEEYER